MSIEIEPAPWRLRDLVTIRIYPDGHRERGQVVDLRHDGTRWIAEVEHSTAALTREHLPAADLMDWDHGMVTLTGDDRWIPVEEATDRPAR